MASFKSSRTVTLSVDESTQINEKSILCAGWVTKQGHFRKNWKERYFVLASEGSGIRKRCSIFYFKEKWTPGDSQLPLGAFPLHGATISCTQPPSDKPQPWYTFDVWTCFDHKYPLRCRSERERDLWMSQIGAAIRNEEAPDLDRSDAAVLDGTKLDYYQVPEKKKEDEAAAAQSSSRRALPRTSAAERAHTAREAQAAENSDSNDSEVVVEARIKAPVVVVAKQTEPSTKIKAQIQEEKARRAKLQVLDEWLFNADLGHLRQKIKSYGIESLEDLTDPIMRDKTVLQESFELRDGAWEIDRLAQLQVMIIEATGGRGSNKRNAATNRSDGQGRRQSSTNQSSEHNNNHQRSRQQQEEQAEIDAILEDKMVKKALYMSSLEVGESTYHKARSMKQSLANNKKTEERTVVGGVGLNEKSVKELFATSRFQFEKALATALELNQIISKDPEILDEDINVTEDSLDLLQERIDSCKKYEDEIFLNKSMPAKKSKSRARMKSKDDSDDSEQDDEGQNQNQHQSRKDMSSGQEDDGYEASSVETLPDADDSALKKNSFLKSSLKKPSPTSSTSVTVAQAEPDDDDEEDEQLANKIAFL